MLKKILIASILSCSLSFATGFEVGAKIKVVKRDGGIINTVIREMEYKLKDRKFNCIDSNGNFFKVAFNNVDKITTKRGIKFKSSSSNSKYNVQNLRLIDGESVDCGIAKSITIWVSPNSAISPHRLKITDYKKYNSLEVSNAITSDTKGIIIELMDGRRITVPVSKNEIKSIIFE